MIVFPNSLEHPNKDSWGR
jgi:hypothetical protein